MLARDAQGAEVARLQKRLVEIGWPLLVDGSFGLRTDAVVLAMQKELGLERDGIVGATTTGALSSAVPRDRADPVEVLAGVPYRSQRDNANNPKGTCNVTCMAMVLDALGVDAAPGKQLEDELFDDINGPEGRAEFRASHGWAVGKLNPWNVHPMLDWAAARRGWKIDFTEAAPWSEIRAELRAGRPVITSGTFTGAGGHIVVLVGLTAAGDLIVHDPWGDWNRGYRGASSGNARVYVFEEVQGVLRGSGGNKWAHFVRGYLSHEKCRAALPSLGPRSPPRYGASSTVRRRGSRGARPQACRRPISTSTARQDLPCGATFGY